MQTPRLMTVLAHPDDESHGELCLLSCCARGESGMERARARRFYGFGTQASRVRLNRNAHVDSKAADLSGLGTASIRWIATDEKLRMDLVALRRQIEADTAAGDVPCLVVGTTIFAYLRPWLRRSAATQSWNS